MKQGFNLYNIIFFLYFIIDLRILSVLRSIILY